MLFVTFTFSAALPILVPFFLVYLLVRVVVICREKQPRRTEEETRAFLSALRALRALAPQYVCPLSPSPS